MRQPAPHRLGGPLGHRRQPFLVALAAQASGKAGPDGAPGAAAKPARSPGGPNRRAVQAGQGCAAPTARRSPRVLRPRRTSPRPHAYRGFSATDARSRGRGSAADGSSPRKPLVEQETVESPQRRGAAGHGRGRQLRPGLAKPSKRSGIGAFERSKHLGRRFQIAAIGKQRVARRARLRRHHVAEAVDQRAVALSSRPRQRLGGDHPRQIILPGACAAH